MPMPETNQVPRVLAIASGKGGVGKTNIAVNLGISLAEAGRRVVLMDADLGLANVDVLLGFHPRFNLSHVLSGERSLSEIMVDGPSGLRIIPASSGLQHMSDLSTTEQAAVIRVFSDIDKDIDFLLVDTAAGISSSVVNFARACQEVVLIVCDEPTSITDAYAFIKLLNRDYGVYRFQILTNMVQDTRQGQALFYKLNKVTDHYLDVTLNHLGTIPFDDFLRKAVQRQSPVTISYPQSKSSLAFRQLSERVMSLPATRHSSGRLEFFVEKMIQYGNLDS